MGTSVSCGGESGGKAVGKAARAARWRVAVWRGTADLGHVSLGGEDDESDPHLHAVCDERHVAREEGHLPCNIQSRNNRVTVM